MLLEHVNTGDPIIIIDTTRIDDPKPLLLGLHATSVHPGGIGTTDLPRHMDPALLVSMMTEHTNTHLKSAEQGSSTTVWATVSR